MMSDNFSFIGKLIKNLKNLTEEEAYTLMKGILKREISDIKIAAILTALRIKRESSEELYGFYKAMKEFVRCNTALPHALDIASNYDGKVRTLYILPSAVVIAEHLGVSLTYHWAERVPAKMGITLGEVLKVLGIKISSLHQRDFIPELYELLPLRRELGIRTVFNVLEKLLNPFGAEKIITSVFHKPYFEKVYELCEKVGFRGITVIKGVEGGIEPLTDRPTFIMRGDDVEKIDPDKLGIKLPKNVETPNVLKDSVEINKMILSGNAPEEFKNWACLTASVLLLADGKFNNVEEAFEASREALNGISS